LLGNQGYQGYQGHQGNQGNQGKHAKCYSCDGCASSGTPQYYYVVDPPDTLCSDNCGSNPLSTVVDASLCLRGYQGYQGHQGHQGYLGYQGYQGHRGNQGFQGHGHQGHQGQGLTGTWVERTITICQGGSNVSYIFLTKTP